ncbi:MAG TPA: response regulator receiver protein, partial [Pseudonocardiaceae bacterium]
MARAEEALREALGDDAGVGGLPAAVMVFEGRAAGVLEPLRELVAAVETVRAATGAELRAAAGRADEAQRRAAEEAG